jgi:methylenetetrahydrofolate reductase (NADPH)
VAVTCSPSKGVDATLAFTTSVSHLGFHVIPHLAARAVSDRVHLREITAQLSELAIDTIFVPGGDAAKPVGIYATALDLLRDLAEIGHGFQHIGIAAHPEGHPDASDAELLGALQQKQPLATYAVTQMCFDTQRLCDWLRRMRTSGIALPVRLGIPGVSDRAALLKTSLRIGVGDSLRFLKRKSTVVTRLMSTKAYTPGALLGGIAPMLVDEVLNVLGLHVFCFNQVESFETWRQQAIANLVHAETV